MGAERKKPSTDLFHRPSCHRFPRCVLFKSLQMASPSDIARVHINWHLSPPFFHTNGWHVYCPKLCPQGPFFFITVFQGQLWIGLSWADVHLWLSLIYLYKAFQKSGLSFLLLPLEPLSINRGETVETDAMGIGTSCSCSYLCLLDQFGPSIGYSTSNFFYLFDCLRSQSQYTGSSLHHEGSFVPTHVLKLWSMGSVVVACRLGCTEACGIFILQPGIEPTSPALQGRFLTTGPRGKFLMRCNRENPVSWFCRSDNTQFMMNTWVW